jgi:hypothetical protein
MAISYASIGDLTVPEILNREIELLLADRASLRNLPYLVNVGDITGSNTNTIKVGYAGLDGYNEMSAVAEGSDAPEPGLTDGSQTVVVARQAITYSEYDLTNLILANGNVDVERLAASIVGDAEARFTSMVCGVIDDFTQTSGTTGTDFTFAKFQSAIYTLERAPAPTAELVAVLAPIQLTDLQSDVTGLTGVMQWQPASAEMIAAKGQGFQGRLLGVDVYKSSKVVTSGGDRKGGMWHRGAVLMAEGTPKPLLIPGIARDVGQKIQVTFGYNNAKALQSVTGNYYVGVARSVPNDTLGVTLISSAT